MVNCRGRNGWFKLGSWMMRFVPSAGHVCIELNSVREGKTPPIIFEGSTAKIKSLLFDMIDLIDAAERANRNEHIRIPYRG
jgi:hypothetical protein